MWGEIGMRDIMFFLGIGVFIIEIFFPELRGGILNNILAISIMVIAVILIVQSRKDKKS